MLLSVTLNPSVDHTVYVGGIKLHDTNRVRRTERDAGGKGINVARVYSELGGESLATGFLAGGPGAHVRHVLERQGVRHDFVAAEGETRVNFSVESGDGPPTTFNEQGPEIGSPLFDALIQKCKALSGNARWMALGGSLPPGVPGEAFATLINACRRKGIRFALDSDGEPLKLGIASSPDFIKPNAKEAGRLLGRDIRSRGAALAAARELLAMISAADGRFVVISLGQEGAVLANGESLFEGIAPEVEARSTIGSGDSMIAGIVWALDQGESIEEAFRWGLAAGAATATTDGTEIARRPTVLELLPRATVKRAG